MKRPPVQLTPSMRPAACIAIGIKLCELDVQIIDLAITDIHYHLLARFTPYTGDLARPATPSVCVAESQRRRDRLDPAPRVLLGRAKKHSSHLLREQGLHDQPGGLWAVRGLILPIRGRTHQINVANYVVDHVHQDGVVLSRIRPDLVARVSNRS